MASSSSKPIVLHLGDDIKYNHDYYNNTFAQKFQVVKCEEKDRESFIKALKENKYGPITALFRPHFQSGGEMGPWDADGLIPLLPPSVRIFASAGAGFNWADVESLGKRGIWYSNGAGASDDAVSDTALWMILGVFRNFWRSEKAARTCDPEKFLQAHRLIGGISWNPRGHVLGIVGLGNISKKLAKKAKWGLGMEVHYFDVVRAKPEEEEEELGGVTFHESLEGLLAVSDVVSLHCPLNQHTRDMMNAERFGQMKDGARLVNTARGEIVVEEALVEALRSGKLSAAGLDVHYYEPQVSRDLAEMENVILTTHNGGGALTTRLNFELNAMKNIVKVVSAEDGGYTGEEPITPVNRKWFAAAK